MDAGARRALEEMAREALYQAARLGPEGEPAALYARRLLEGGGIRRPYEYRLVFCRRCKRYSPVGVSRTIRLRRGRIVFRCSLCGATYRKVLRGAHGKNTAARSQGAPGWRSGRTRGP